MKKYYPKNISLIKKLLPAALAILSTSAFALSPLPFPVWSVEGGKLLDPNGNPFIFRGVTIDHTLAPEKTVQALKDLAALGANSAQIEFAIKLDDGYPRKVIAQLREIIQTCKDSKLVCVLEANDASGYSQAPGSTSPSNIAYYWGISDMRAVLEGAQGHIIIGFSNQIFDSNYNIGAYAVRMDTYLSELKNGLPMGYMVMIDGNKWGQDTDKAMLEYAKRRSVEMGYDDVIYSIDMFDAYTDPAKARDYIASFAQLDAALVVGGFGPVPYYHPHNDGVRAAVIIDLPAQSIMQYAEQYGAGYFGWSWSGSKQYGLDVVNNWDINSLTSWGNLLFNDANGIKATAKTASIFSGSSSSSSVSSSTPANSPPVAMFEVYNSYSGSCTNGRITATATGTYDPDGDDLTYSWSLSGGGGSATGYSTSFTSRSGDSYQLTLTVTDSKGASVSLTKSVSPIYIDCVSSASSTSRSSSVTSSSSSVDIISSRSSASSSSIIRSSVSSSSRSSISSSLIASSSSSAISLNNCSYVIQSQWNNGFTAVIRIKNTSAQVINGWDVNWQYGDGSKITNLWNASLSGSNPYNAKNLSWNTSIQPGQTVEFGFQGSKSAAAASVPVVSGNICK